MTIKVQKWGNSLGVRIPRKIANSLHLVSGTEVEVTVKENTIVIKNNYSELDRLVQNINQANIHKEQFIEAFHSQAIKKETQETFALAQQYASSYPTLLIEKEGKLYILEQGFAPIEGVLKQIDTILN